MPRPRRMNRRRVNRRRGRKPFNKRGGVISTLRGNNIPDKMLVKFKFAQAGISDIASFNIAKTWRLNSIYDPDQALGGTSVSGFAQWRALYTKYRVYAVSYRIQLVNEGPVSIVGSTLPAAQAVTMYSYSELTTQPNAKKFMLGPVSGQNRTIIGGKLYLPRLIGQNNVQYMADEDYSSLFGANPFSVPILALIAQPIDQVTPCKLSWTCNITFHTEVFGKKTAYVDTLDMNDVNLGRVDLSGNPVDNDVPNVGVPPNTDLSGNY